MKQSRPALHVEILEDRCTPSTLLALNGANQIVAYDSNSPSTPQGATRTLISPGGVPFVSLAYRPGTGQLYGLALSGNLGQLYTIDLASGVATQVPTTGATLNLQGDFASDLAWSPDGQTLRIMADNDSNYAFNAGAQTISHNPSLQYGGMGSSLHPGVFNAQVSAITYVGNTLFGFDNNTGDLVAIDPNTGSVSSVNHFRVGGVDQHPGNAADESLDTDSAGNLLFTAAIPGSALVQLNPNVGSDSTIKGSFGPNFPIFADVVAVPSGVAVPTDLAPATPSSGTTGTPNTPVATAPAGIVSVTALRTSKGAVVGLKIRFDSAMNPATVRALKNYALRIASPGHSRAGKIASISYDAKTHTATLLIKFQPNDTRATLTVNSAAITDLHGIALDGDHDSHPGGKAVFTVNVRTGRGH